MSYQDSWVRGKVTSRGRRDCKTRYDAIVRELPNVPKPSRVFDIGAAEGYFSFRLAELWRMHVVAADHSPALQKAWAANGSPKNVRILGRLSPQDVRSYGAFDVALLLSVLHHVPNWRDFLDAVREQASFVVIETPHPDEDLPKAKNAAELGDIEAAVKALPGARVICQVPGYDARFKRNTYWVPSPGNKCSIGTVFTGGGRASRPKHNGRWQALLGYIPFPGSLNLRLARPLALANPAPLELPGPKDFQFWPGTVRDFPVLLMRPGSRGHHGTIEVVAKESLRKKFHLHDGEQVDVCVTS